MTARDEFGGADLGDKRLGVRLVRMAALCAEDPAASFPQALKSEAALEGAYRFLNHEAVTPAKILQPHVRASVARAAAVGQIVVAHDTTELSYSTPREGLGWITTGGHGVFVHVALAVAGEGTGQPVGVLGLDTFVRTGKPKRKTMTKRQRLLQKEPESRRWAALVEAVHAQLGDASQAIHVMDREADSYALLVPLLAHGRRFVIRVRADRRLDGEDGTLFPALRKLEVQLCRTVRLARRDKPTFPTGPHAAREERLAKLVVAGGRYTFKRPRHVASDLPKTLAVNVVHVHEPAPPAGCEPVEWMLLTSEPIACAEDLARVVDAYRMRWQIEELFKALKSGCAIEERQLESKHALLNALALYLPIAWNLFRLRHLARCASDTPATDVLTDLQVRILRTDPHAKLTGTTISDALLAVARLGGHLRRNGDPGWQILGRGYKRLLLLDQGARLAMNCERCDQS
jgi:hypothetical protein